jgi:hypothetical protein
MVCCGLVWEPKRKLVCGRPSSEPEDVVAKLRNAILS